LAKSIDDIVNEELFLANSYHSLKSMSLSHEQQKPALGTLKYYSTPHSDEMRAKIRV
jgi:hypothetical protein